MALEYRHELKYVVSHMQIELLRNRIRPFMTLDTHADEKNGYQIRSIYFDDWKNTCFYENEEGTSPREKFRIRIYNGDSKSIRLELKQKIRGKTHKESCILNKEQSDNILDGKGLPDDNRYPAVLQKFCLEYKTRMLRPKVIVEYDREPYVYKNGNVRVTFDTDIRSSKEKNSFFEKQIFARPIMPAGSHLMEIKYDEFLPDYIYKALQLENLRLATYSKYYLCRKYNLGGITNHGI